VSRQLRLDREAVFRRLMSSQQGGISAVRIIGFTARWLSNVLGPSGYPTTRGLARERAWLAHAGIGACLADTLHAGGCRPQSSPEPRTLLARGR
jgi:hypothetical protein